MDEGLNEGLSEGMDEQAARRPRIGLTIGDPAGIGPEVALKAAVNDEVLSVCAPVLIGDAQYLNTWARAFGLARDFQTIEAGQPIPEQFAAPLIYDLANIMLPPAELEMGRDQAECGRAAGEFIEAAVRLCESAEIEAMTTAPISKRALALGGYHFPGHTEMLAHLSGCRDFAMAFFSPRLRVALLSTHIALSKVPEIVRREDLARLIRLVARELQLYGIERPRLAVAAVNPHGGEGGLFGTEEAEQMQPAIEECRESDGIDVSGPYAGDTIFLRAARGEFDLVVSCYHDQGLIAVKCLSFGEAVNVTLGLPFIRTSVDHGTAYDIAGEGRADAGSMVEAIKLAADLYRKRSLSEV